MIGLEGVPLGSAPTTIRIDLQSQFDSVDGAVYTASDKKYFLPYVPGNVVTGPAELALFSLTAAAGEQSAPCDGEAQVHTVIDKLQHTLASMGAGFDNVILLWNRCAHLDRIENAVLMSRAKKGLTRPLAEAVLEIVSSDPNPPAPDGTPAAIEYVAVSHVPR
eukprot:UN2949